MPEIPPPDFKTVGKAVAKGVEEAGTESGFWTKIQDIAIAIAAAILAMYYKIASQIGLVLAQSITEAENRSEDVYADIAAAGIEDLFGTKPNVGQFKGRHTRAARRGLSRELGDSVFDSLFPQASSDGSVTLQPGDGAAKEWMGFMLQFAMEGWLSGWTAELASLGELETFGELDDIVSQVMGFGRLSRRVLSPAVDAFIVTPTEWKINKQARPRLLTVAQTIEEYNAGRYKREDVEEELSRQGYSTDRINSLIAAAAKVFSVSDITFLRINNYWSVEQATQFLERQGYSAELAAGLFDIARLRMVENEKEKFRAAAVQAFINRDIDQVTCSRLLDTSNIHPDVKTYTMLAAGLKRELNIKTLSESDAEQAVKRGFWTLRQFTDYLKDRGMLDEDILTKQLLLQDEIAVDAAAASKRRQAEEERAKEKAERKAAALRRQAELEAERSRQELTLSQVERAFVRGRITSSEYMDYLAAEKIAPVDIQVLLDLATAERAEYLESAASRERVDRKLAATTLNAGQLERAVELEDITLDRWREILTEQGVTPVDIDLLQHQLTVNIEERAAAKARRAAIEAQARQRGVNIVQVERAVRQGLRTVTQYREFLAGAGYGPEDQGLLAGLLEAQLAEDAAVRRRREEIAAALSSRRISLPDLERAVRRGLRPIADYRSLLVSQGIVGQDVDTLVALLQLAMADDVELRKRKAEIEARAGQRIVGLEDSERAVRLGIIGIDWFKVKLRDLGFNPDESAILLALLKRDMEDAAAAREARRVAEEKTKNRAVPLSDVARAVKAGLRSLRDYKIAVNSEGFSDEAAALMVELLQAELKAREVAQARRDELNASRQQRELTRAELERAIKAGLIPFEDYVAFLDKQGYEQDDSATLQWLLKLEMEKSSGG
jgi:hypothetical protein